VCTQLVTVIAILKSKDLNLEYWVPIFYYKSVSIRLRGRPRGLTPRRKEDVSTTIRTAPRSGRVRTTVCAFFSRKHAHATKKRTDANIIMLSHDSGRGRSRQPCTRGPRPFAVITATCVFGSARWIRGDGPGKTMRVTAIEINYRTYYYYNNNLTRRRNITRVITAFTGCCERKHGPGRPRVGYTARDTRVVCALPQNNEPRRRRFVSYRYYTIHYPITRIMLYYIKHFMINTTIIGVVVAKRSVRVTSSSRAAQSFVRGANPRGFDF